MHKYKNFSVEDFLQDEFFHKWASDPYSKEAEVWERWLDENREMRKVAEDAKKIIESLEDAPIQLTPRFYSRLKARIDSSINYEKDKKSSVLFIPRWIKMVAVFTGLLVVAGLLLDPSPKEEFLIYSSKYAETRKILLPGGSEVVLNANSTLTYKASHKNQPREVWLNGEGFFKIKHIEEKAGTPQKFIVHTKDVNVEVLGTEFNVNNNAVDKTEVLLTKGKVRLSLTEENIRTVIMKPNELVNYDNRSKALVVTKVSAENYISWLNHKFIFEKVTLEELSKELYHYYGKQITIVNPALSKLKLSGTLELQDEDALIQTLAALLSVKINKKGNQIIIGSN